MLRNSFVAAVARTRPQAKPLAMTTMKKSNHGFSLVPFMGIGFRLEVLWAAGALLLIISEVRKRLQNEVHYNYSLPTL